MKIDVMLLLFPGDWSQSSADTSTSSNQGGLLLDSSVVGHLQGVSPQQPLITTLLPPVPCPYKGWHLYIIEGDYLVMNFLFSG